MMRRLPVAQRHVDAARRKILERSFRAYSDASLTVKQGAINI